MSKTDKTLKKCDELIERLQQLKKAIGDVTQAPSNRTPANALGTGWSQDPGTGTFHHSSHGVISTSKHPDGYFQINHGGRSVGRAASPAEAGTKIKNYVGSLGAGDTGMHNLDPTKLGKEDEEMDKSGYGPKRGNQYNQADNVKRKLGNVGDERVGTQSVKSYTHNKVFNNKVPKGPASPVKQYSPEQIAAINEARKLKKNADDAQAWANHANIPSAYQELAKAQLQNPVEKAEGIMANQLANMMAGRAMLGKPPAQPTDEQLFGHLVPSEEDIQKAEANWGGRMNWLEEATKPISARFASEEEELAYWRSLKTDARGTGGDHGF